ncbi:MAG: hypothetical protein AABX01_01280 [Candidatus Micrarchaeota archaeon]
MHSSLRDFDERIRSLEVRLASYEPEIKSYSDVRSKLVTAMILGAIVGLISVAIRAFDIIR